MRKVIVQYDGSAIYDASGKHMMSIAGLGYEVEEIPQEKPQEETSTAKDLVDSLKELKLAGII